MGLFNGLSKEVELDKLADITRMTIIGYVVRQIQGLQPKEKLNAGPTTVIDLTLGQVLNLLFAHAVNISGSAASPQIKDDFTRRVQPKLTAIAKSVIINDPDIRLLALENLNQRVAFLQRRYGAQWERDPRGERVMRVLKTVFESKPGKPMSLFKYRARVFSFNAKYENLQSITDWRAVLQG